MESTGRTPIAASPSSLGTSRVCAVRDPVDVEPVTRLVSADRSVLSRRLPSREVNSTTAVEESSEGSWSRSWAARVLS